MIYENIDECLARTITHKVLFKSKKVGLIEYKGYSKERYELIVICSESSAIGLELQPHSNHTIESIISAHPELAGHRDDITKASNVLAGIK